jgi:ATP-dependent DNA helicase RecQ
VDFKRINMDLLILTSPPATGKTFWIESLILSLEHETILVISPLRALADECKTNWGDKVLVMTPEEWLNKEVKCSVNIFDEFHLYFYWGDTFRSKMWEAFYAIAMNSTLTVALTATFSKNIQREVCLFSSHFDSILWIDFGNQKLKFKPKKYVKAPSKKWLIEKIQSSPKKDGVKLIFCQYREEVFEMERKLTSLGYVCHSCVGGEAHQLVQKLIINLHPDFIICTTVLSHGVNLPSIREIYFLYQINQLDFWIQMVARGGRKGEDFEVFSLEQPLGLSWNMWANFFNVFYFSLKQYFSLRSLLEQLFISK